MVVTRIVTNHIAPQERGVCGEFTVTLDNELCIHRISVVSGEKGLFITFPNTGEMRRFTKAKRYTDIVHPTKNSLRQHIQTEVLKRYREELADLNM